MAENSNKDTLADLVDKALRMVRERSASLKNGPFPLYESIENQLIFINNFIKNQKNPTEDDRESIVMGVQALRELGDNDPEFAKLLMKINDQFDTWEV